MAEAARVGRGCSDEDRLRGLAGDKVQRLGRPDADPVALAWWHCNAGRGPPSRLDGRVRVKGLRGQRGAVERGAVGVDIDGGARQGLG